MKVNIKPNVRRLHEIYRFLGADYDGRVLPSVGNEVLKSVLARFTATQLINERDQVSAKVRDLLSERLAEFNIEIGELALSEMKFGAEFSRAVEEKQVAQQMADRAKYLVAAAEQ
jgi:prohibitin 2